MRLRKLRRILVTTLVMVVITLVLLEVGLAIFDPLGLSYFQQIHFIEPFYGSGNGSYTLSPGTYYMKRWTAHVTDDLKRAMPDNGEGCNVLFLGDSLTWGWGVDDADTFVNLLAHEANLHATNAAMIGYSSENIADALDVYDDYDLAVYLLFINDHEETWAEDRPLQPPGDHYFSRFGLYIGDTPMIGLYALYAARRTLRPTSAVYWDRFYADMERITAHDRLLIFAFDSPLTTEAVQRYDELQVIDWYTHEISPADLHPDVQGHQEIAAAMLPHLQARLNDAQC